MSNTSVGADMNKHAITQLPPGAMPLQEQYEHARRTMYAGVRLLLLDLDGTVRRCTVEGQPCPNQPGEQELLPGAAEAIVAAQRAGIKICFVSNQAGVAYGFMSEMDLFHIDQELSSLLDDAGADHTLIGSRYCTDKSGWHRKPEPGMLLEAMVEYQIGPDHTLMVGDLSTDLEAALAARVRHMDAAAWREPWTQEAHL